MKFRRNKLLKGASLMLLALIMLCSAFILQNRGDAVSYAAPASITATHVKDADVNYFFVEGMSSVAASDDGIFTSDDNNIYHFDISGEYQETVSFSGIDKLVAGSNKLFLLSAGEVYYAPIGSNGISTFTTIGGFNNVTDIDLNDGVLYIAIDNSITLYDTATDTQTETLTTKKTPASISFFDGDIYYSAKSSAKAYTDIYRADAIKPSIDLLKINSPKIIGGKKLYFMSAGTLKFNEDLQNSRLLTEISTITDVVDFCVYNDSIYCITNKGALYQLNEVGFLSTLLFASDSDAAKYYSFVQGVSVRAETLVAADYGNDRIFVRKNGFNYIPVFAPVATALDNNGTVYAAHSDNKISVYSAGYNPTETIDFNGSVTDIQIDYQNNLYVLSEDNLYIRANNSFDKIAENVTAFTVSAFTNKVYYANGNSVYCTDDTSTPAFSITNNIVSLAIDANNKFYILADDDSDCLIVKSSIDGSDAAYYTIDGASANSTQITLSLGNVGLVEWGDIIITDTYTHRLMKISATDLGVKWISEFDDTNVTADERIIRPINSTSYIYETPSEQGTPIKVTSDNLLIVPKYDLVTNANFSYVMYDDQKLNKLYIGYVLKSVLSEPLEYVAPPAVSAYVYFDNTIIYEYPSALSKKLKTGLSKNTELSMKYFANYSSNGHKWYKVTYGDITGYVSASSVSVMNFLPDVSIRPQTNGEIISKDDSTGAHVYRLVDGEYTLIEGAAMLLVGKRVEIVELFDTSKEFTLIRYYDEEMQATSECYVKTIYVKYDSVTLIQVLAIILIVLAGVLIIILVARWLIYRKKNTAVSFAKDDESDDNFNQNKL